MHVATVPYQTGGMESTVARARLQVDDMVQSMKSYTNESVKCGPHYMLTRDMPKLAPPGHPAECIAGRPPPLCFQEVKVIVSKPISGVYLAHRSGYLSRTSQVIQMAPWPLSDLPRLKPACALLIAVHLVMYFRVSNPISALPSTLPP